MLPHTMQTPLNFKLFYKSNANLMSTNYPFLSRSQINARLRQKWKKINEESKQKPQGKSGSFKTHKNLDTSIINDEIGQVSFWKPANKRTQTYAGGEFRLNTKVPEVQFDEKMSKTSILKKNSSPAQKFKAGQVSFSSDVKNDSYDLSDDQEDKNIYVKINNPRRSSNRNNQFANSQGICNQMDSYDEKNDLFHKTTSFQVGKEKQEHSNFEFPSKQSLNNIKQKSSLETGREKETFYDKLALNNKQTLYYEDKSQTDREVCKTITNLDKLDVPITDMEMLDDDENFYTFEDDDDDAVLLIRTDNSYTHGLENDYDITEFKNETVGKKSMMMFNEDDAKMNISQDNCQRPEFTTSNDKKDLLQTPKCHSMTLRRESQKIQENSNSFQNKPTKSEKIKRKPVKMTKPKDISSLLEEDIESKMERFFNAGISVSHDDSHTKSKVQKACNKKFHCRYPLQNCDNFPTIDEPSKNKKNMQISSDIDSTSPDSSELREETQESFFYSPHDAEDTEERRPIINQMFEDLETRTSNSLFIPTRKRLLTSNAFQTSSNFGTMLLEDDEIFL